MWVCRHRCRSQIMFLLGVNCWPLQPISNVKQCRQSPIFTHQCCAGKSSLPPGWNCFATCKGQVVSIRCFQCHATPCPLPPRRAMTLTATSIHQTFPSKMCRCLTCLNFVNCTLCSKSVLTCLQVFPPLLLLGIFGCLSASCWLPEPQQWWLARISACWGFYSFSFSPFHSQPLVEVSPSCPASNTSAELNPFRNRQGSEDMFCPVCQHS